MAARKPKPPFIFTVEGDGYFPYDMLRYDQCWPRHELDAYLLEDRKARVKSRRRVELMSNTRPPTAARWRSFGWDVVEVRPS